MDISLIILNVMCFLCGHLLTNIFLQFEFCVCWHFVSFVLLMHCCTSFPVVTLLYFLVLSHVCPVCRFCRSVITRGSD